jgi:uncharacterized membrane protein YidH (DUF202 family)
MTGSFDDGGRAAQLERTVLSWNRAAIAVAANGALVVRAGFEHESVVLQVIGVAVAVVGFALWALSLRRYSIVAGRQVHHLFEGRLRGVVPVAAFVIGLSLIDVGVVVSTG